MLLQPNSGSMIAVTTANSIDGNVTAKIATDAVLILQQIGNRRLTCCKC